MPIIPPDTPNLLRPATAPTNQQNFPSGALADLSRVTDPRLLPSHGGGKSGKSFFDPLPTVSAVTTPRAAWGDDRDSGRGGVSFANDCANTTEGRRQGDEKMDGPLAPAGQVGTGRRDGRGCTLQGRRAIASPAGTPRRSSFGRPSTQVREQHRR